MKRVLLGTNQYDNIEVASNLSLDFSSTEVTEHNYTPADGQAQGVLSSEDVFSSENTNSSGGVPGTDSNGEETTYEMQDSDSSSSTTSEERRTYLPNERVMSQSIPPGLIDYEQSSISVAAVTYNVQREEDIRSQGLLDGISWEEYKAANGERVSQPVDENIINMVSKATGIASENIAMVAYEEPLFIDKEGMNIGATDIIQVVLILIILGLLGFVVFRSMRSEKPVEQEEELSVEDLLQSTPSEGDLGNVVLEDMSDTRRMIEKFVDDNPEAVANLLRNWLNEDWG